jgi:cation diffusion facilitator CzcD-associated flavoprotein CzcO
MMANNYADMLIDETANREAYNFWAKKVRARISNPEKRDILAPLEPPHPFAGKRVSLEQDFYEQMDRPHVNIIDIKKNPITEIQPEGIVTADGKLHHFDIIALATGFDGVTGGLKDIEVTGNSGEMLSEKWHTGTWTYLGISTAGFPNFFFIYGPQASTGYSNGPSCVEPQCDWVVEVLKCMRTEGKTRIDAKRDAELAWKQHFLDVHAKSLRDKVDGWYLLVNLHILRQMANCENDRFTGTNVPGKPREPLSYAGGIPLYIKKLNEALGKGLEGFSVE